MDLDFTNDTIEKMLLKKALSDKHWLSILSNVYDSLFGKIQNKEFREKKSLFKNRDFSLILRLAMKYFQKYDKSPDNNVIQLLAKKYQELHPAECIDVAKINTVLSELQNANYNIGDDILNKNFKDFIRSQAMYETLSQNVEILTSENGDYQKVVDKCLENFDKVQKITFDDTDLGMQYFNEAAMKEHWDFLKNPEAKIKTLWRKVDDITNGGFLKDGRMLALIMAQAGLGKSVFLSNLAVNFMKQNLSVVVISLEMSENVYAARFDAHISKKNINRLAENEEVATERIREFYQQHPKANLFIKEYPPRSVRTRDIANYLENLKNAGHHFDVIIIDYLGLVLPNRSQDSMYKDGQMVSEELRSLSYLFRVPVISAVKCNSEGMNNATIDMQNVAESKAIVHTVDFLAVLTRTPDERELGKINMRILKNRFGGQIGAVCSFRMDNDTLEIADTSYDNDIESSTTSNMLKNFKENKQNIESSITDW